MPVQVGKTFDGIVECILCHGKRKKRYGHFGWFSHHVVSKHIPMKDDGDEFQYIDFRRFFLEDDIVYMYSKDEMHDYHVGILKIRGVEVGSYHGVNP